MTARKMLVALVASVAITATNASALEFNGYLRGGPGWNSDGGTQACFQLPGSYFKARLGNECDRYGEFAFSQTGKTDAAEWSAVFMPAYYQPLNGSTSNNILFVQQAYVALKIPALNGAEIWAGSRYFQRHDVHSIDWFYFNLMQGNLTVGVDDIKLGFAKAGVNLISIDALNINGPGTRGSVEGAYMVPDFRLYDIGLYPNGFLEVAVDLAMAYDHSTAGVPATGLDRQKTSVLATIEHRQEKFLGGTNKLTFQYGTGSMAKATGDGPGNQTLQGGTSADKQWRVIEHFVFQPTPQITGALVLVYQDISGDANSAIGNQGSKIMTAELRPAFQLAPWFKLAADLFYQSIDYKDAGPSNADLMKFTLAPTFMVSPGYYGRPEIRLYWTYGSWNDGAVASGTMAQGAFGTSKSGSSFGAQAEIWW